MVDRSMKIQGLVQAARDLNWLENEVGYGIEELHRFKKQYKLREDWHEPDEQEVSAFVVGNKLDNAMGDKPWVRLNQFGLPEVGELVVVVQHSHYYDDGSSTVDDTVMVNLADLLADATKNGGA